MARALTASPRPGVPRLPAAARRPEALRHSAISHAPPSLLAAFFSASRAATTAALSLAHAWYATRRSASVPPSAAYARGTYDLLRTPTPVATTAAAAVHCHECAEEHAARAASASSAAAAPGGGEAGAVASADAARDEEATDHRQGAEIGRAHV